MLNNTKDANVSNYVRTTSNILLADFVARDAVLNTAITTNAYSDFKVLTYLNDITTKTIGGILQVGVSSGGGIIKLGGTADDIGFDLATIQNRDYASGKSEIVIFKGNDIEGTSGADRIRLRAGAIAFDTYSTASTSAITQSIRMYIDGAGNVGIGTTIDSLAQATTLGFLSKYKKKFFSKDDLYEGLVFPLYFSLLIGVYIPWKYLLFLG